MKNAVLLHGTDDNPEKNWFPWLKKELERNGYMVYAPLLPNCNKPNVDTYNKFLLKSCKFDSDTILIGHSSGAVEILSLLQNLPKGVVIKKSILIAGFIDNLKWDALDDLFIHPFDWKEIKSRSKSFIFVHSDNDPYVPLEHGKYLHKKLGGELIIKKGQKHFTVGGLGSKYEKFPLILDLVD